MNIYKHIRLDINDRYMLSGSAALMDRLRSEHPEMVKRLGLKSSTITSVLKFVSSRIMYYIIEHSKIFSLPRGFGVLSPIGINRKTKGFGSTRDLRLETGNTLFRIHIKNFANDIQRCYSTYFYSGLFLQDWGVKRFVHSSLRKMETGERQIKTVPYKYLNSLKRKTYFF